MKGKQIRKWALPALGVFTGALLIVALTRPAAAAVGKRLGKKLAPEVVASARKWALRRGLPLDWVLATIMVESGGDPRRVGDFHVDPKGASVGLMQINTRAHAGRLAIAGVSRDDLFNVDRNIEWGTLILREAADKVRAALARRPSSVPLDVLVRLTYKGVAASSAVVEGRDPTVAYAVPVSLWQQALSRTSVMV